VLRPAWTRLGQQNWFQISRGTNDGFKSLAS